MNIVSGDASIKTPGVLGFSLDQFFVAIKPLIYEASKPLDKQYENIIEIETCANGVLQWKEEVQVLKTASAASLEPKTKKIMLDNVEVELPVLEKIVFRRKKIFREKENENTKNVLQVFDATLYLLEKKETKSYPVVDVAATAPGKPPVTKKDKDGKEMLQQDTLTVTVAYEDATLLYSFEQFMYKTDYIATQYRIRRFRKDTDAMEETSFVFREKDNVKGSVASFEAVEIPGFSNNPNSFFADIPEELNDPVINLISNLVYGIYAHNNGPPTASVGGILSSYHSCPEIMDSQQHMHVNESNPFGFLMSLSRKFMVVSWQKLLGRVDTTFDMVFAKVIEEQGDGSIIKNVPRAISSPASSKVYAEQVKDRIKGVLKEYYTKFRLLLSTYRNTNALSIPDAYELLKHFVKIEFEWPEDIWSAWKIWAIYEERIYKLHAHYFEGLDYDTAGFIIKLGFVMGLQEFIDSQTSNRMASGKRTSRINVNLTTLRSINEKFFEEIHTDPDKRFKILHAFNSVCIKDYQKIREVQENIQVVKSFKEKEEQMRELVFGKKKVDSQNSEDVVLNLIPKVGLTRSQMETLNSLRPVNILRNAYKRDGLLSAAVVGAGMASGAVLVGAAGASLLGIGGAVGAVGAAAATSAAATTGTALAATTGTALAATTGTALAATTGTALAATTTTVTAAATGTGFLGALYSAGAAVLSYATPWVAPLVAPLATAASSATGAVAGFIGSNSVAVVGGTGLATLAATAVASQSQAVGKSLRVVEKVGRNALAVPFEAGSFLLKKIDQTLRQDEFRDKKMYELYLEPDGEALEKYNKYKKEKKRREQWKNILHFLTNFGAFDIYGDMSLVLDDLEGIIQKIESRRNIKETIEMFEIVKKAYTFLGQSLPLGAPTQFVRYLIVEFNNDPTNKTVVKTASNKGGGGGGDSTVKKRSSRKRGGPLAKRDREVFMQIYKYDKVSTWEWTMDKIGVQRIDEIEVFCSLRALNKLFQRDFYNLKEDQGGATKVPYDIVNFFNLDNTVENMMLIKLTDKATKRVSYWIYGHKNNLLTQKQIYFDNRETPESYGTFALDFVRRTTSTAPKSPPPLQQQQPGPSQLSTEQAGPEQFKALASNEYFKQHFTGRVIRHQNIYDVNIKRPILVKLSPQRVVFTNNSFTTLTTATDLYDDRVNYLGMPNFSAEEDAEFRKVQRIFNEFIKKKYEEVTVSLSSDKTNKSLENAKRRIYWSFLQKYYPIHDIDINNMINIKNDMISKVMATLGLGDRAIQPHMEFKTALVDASLGGLAASTSDTDVTIPRAVPVATVVGKVGGARGSGSRRSTRRSTLRIPLRSSLRKGKKIR